MRRFDYRRGKRSAGGLRLERLACRVLLNATGDDIRAALDLPDGTFVTYSGDSEQIQSRILHAADGFLGFPTGYDADYLMLSTGRASWVDTRSNSAGDQGTDLGEAGEEGDTATIRVKLPVPDSPLVQKLKFDFMFLSEEYPEWVGSEFNDFFTATINGRNIALDQFGNAVTVNNVHFDGELPTDGTFLDGRTTLLTAVYAVPDGTDCVEIELSVGDVGDGIYDSAVILDNLRIEQGQLVYLNFDGQTLEELFGPGTQASVNLFMPSEIGSTAERNAFIARVLDYVEADFSEYQIAFTTDPDDLPASGQYTTMVIGGGGTTTVSVSDWARWYYNNYSGKTSPGLLPEGTIAMEDFEHFLGTPLDEQLLGKSTTVDIGNRRLDDVGVIFAGRLTYGEDPARDLAYVISHEVGHAVGLRHVEDAADMMYYQRLTEGGTWTFQDKLMDLRAEEIPYWAAVGDGATRQNDHAYLNAVLGDEQTGSYLATSYRTEALYMEPVHTFLLGKTDAPLYNVTIGTWSPGQPEFGSQTVFFEEFSNIELGALACPATDTRVFMTASTTPNGTPDLFLGSPVVGGGWQSSAAMFNRNAQPLTTFTIGRIGADGAFQPYTTLDVSKSEYTDVVWLEGNRGEFVDEDGDAYRVMLRGPGRVGLFISDPDHDGRGPVDQIFLQGTDSDRSMLQIAVRPGEGGDGLVSVGGIMGSGLSALIGRGVELTGNGLLMPGDARVDLVYLHAVTGGADIESRGTGSLRGATLVVDRIDPGSELIFGSGVRTFVATSWHGSLLQAPWAQVISIRGDHQVPERGDVHADIVLSGENLAYDGQPTLRLLRIGGALSGDWRITGDVGVVYAASIDSLWSAQVDGEVMTVLSRGDAGGTLTAESIRMVHVRGSLRDAVLRTTDAFDPEGEALGRVFVGMEIDNSQITSAGNIGMVVAGALNASSLTAGAGGPSAMPPATRDSFVAEATIGRVIVRGIRGEDICLADTDIAAWSLGQVRLPEVLVDAGGEAYGLHCVKVDSLMFRNGGLWHIWSSRNLPEQPEGSGDFVVRLL